MIFKPYFLKLVPLGAEPFFLSLAPLIGRASGSDWGVSNVVVARDVG